MSEPTDKQFRYLSVLASKLDLRDEWDLIAQTTGMSRSKAQKSVTAKTASAAIEWAQDRLATRERRATLRETQGDGAIDGDAVLVDGRWVRMSADALALYRQLHGRLDLPRLRVRREELKTDGDATPWMTAMREQVDAGRADLAMERERLVARLAEIDAEIERLE